jgi:hypothetical protein
MLFNLYGGAEWTSVGLDGDWHISRPECVGDKFLPCGSLRMKWPRIAVEKPWRKSVPENRQLM